MPRLSPSVALLRTQSDARLVALAREGHEAAYTAIVERYRRPMLTACRRFLPDARAEDAVQQTFLAAWRGLRRGDEVRELRPWLYRIARNTALNALRTPGYDVVELQESLRVSEAPQDELERREAIRRTLAGLAALPERQREALLRTAVQGAAHADVARDLGLSEGAARQLVMRARTSLRAAASAVVPMPLLQWLVASGGPGVEVAKAGAVAVLAGTAVAAPVVVVDKVAQPGRSEVRTAAPRASAAAPAPAAASVPSVVADEVLAVAEPTAEPRESGHRRRRGRSEDRSGRRDGSSGHDDDDDDDDRRGGDEDDSGSSGSGSSGSDSGSGSGSGSDDDDDGPDEDRSGPDDDD